MIQFGVVTHGGAGSPVEFSDGCETACRAAFALLKEGTPALDAAVEAAIILEDDGRFNAGSGSFLRLDGKTIEMDAAVMDSRNTVGAVISIRDVKNPVLIAREGGMTPFVLSPYTLNSPVSIHSCFRIDQKSSARPLRTYS
jgi:L-asparaginase/beta-aspartyl-peptidase (threonine type)